MKQRDGRSASTKGQPGQPVTLGPVRVDVPVVESPPTQRYHIGVTADCPFDVLYAAGEDFPRRNQDVKLDPDTGETHRAELVGRVVPLTQEQVENIKLDVARKVIRRIGSRAEKISTDHPRFRSVPESDIPMACYLYMVPVTEKMPANWRQAPGTPMAARVSTG